MSRLKLETAAEHAAIERVVPLMSPDLDRAGYAGYLSAMYSVHEPVEQALSVLVGFEAAVPDFAERKKLPLLARDLEALAVGAPGRAPPARLPPLDTVAEGLGVLYVLEGSTLGGRILSRHLSKTLGISPSAGGAYLASYGADLGPMWQRFGASIERFAEASGAADTEIVVRTAKVTFERLGEWLKETGVGNA
jgi:heme oxygenase (biliverdin-IX-beta and delta-forming)